MCVCVWGGGGGGGGGGVSWYIIHIIVSAVCSIGKRHLLLSFHNNDSKLNCYINYPGIHSCQSSGKPVIQEVMVSITMWYIIVSTVCSKHFCCKHCSLQHVCCRKL